MKYMLKLLCLLSFLQIPGIAHAVTLQFFGDVLLSRGIQDLIAHEGIASLWKGVSPIFSQDAIRVANLEGAVGNNMSCVGGRSPCFPIDEKALPVLDHFNVISLANNHSLDLGIQGRSRTVSELQKRALIPLGGKSYTTSIETDNGLISIIALTDVVKSPLDRQSMVMADAPEAIREIQRLKKSTGLVAVYVHWGRELDNLPTPHMKRLAAGLIAAGADIIIGHHPHVVGKTECIQGKPVVYSLGNFLFDQKYEDTKKGAVLQCTHAKDGMLGCSLIGVQAGMNSFIPHLAVEDSAYRDANNILASCVPKRPPVWSGVFSKTENTESKYIREAVDRQDVLSTIKRLDYRGDTVLWKSPPMPIEKMQALDLNGDGLLEMMVIQNVFSSLDNEIAKRVYIYNFNNGLTALWRGSGLSRPLLDAVFVNNVVIKKDKPILIALHSTDSFLVRDPNKGGCVLMSYRWNGFGFTGIKEKQFQLKANKLSISKNKIRLVNNDGKILDELAIAELM